MASFDFSKQEIGVQELIKTPASSTSARREYLRMRAERELAEKAENLLSPIDEEKTKTTEPEKFVMPDVEKTVIKNQEVEPEITSFPFVQEAPHGISKCGHVHIGTEHKRPGHRHGAKLCMVSAVVHMRTLASRKPKTIRELRKNPLTTKQQTYRSNSKDKTDDSDSESEDELAYLRNCRYLRGVDEDKELSIEDIFG